MKKDRDIVDVIRAIAAGSTVDWESADATTADAPTKSVLDELRVIARIAEVHGGSRSDAAALDDAGEGALQSWGPLTVLEQIGRGAYGDVYRAWDSRLDRDVALKLLRQNVGLATSDAPAIEEGRLLARVRHPNVVTVYGADRIDNRVGIWMEFVNGKPLDHIVRETGRLSAAAVAAIGLEVCRGVAAVHRAGLVHRDIKASNVMRQEDGRIVLMDFGTGRASDAAHTTSILGTPLYLAPEVLAGEPATYASDLYSIGVLLYFLLTGSFPVAGTTLADVRHAHRVGHSAATRSTRPTVPRRLAAIIDRAIDPVPSARFPDATAMERALRAYQTAPRRYGLLTAASLLLAIMAVTSWTVGRTAVRNTGGGGGTAAALSVRQIDWPFSWLFVGAPSGDGNWLPYIDARTGNVAILDLRTGATQLVTDDADWNQNRYATASRFSPDARTLAYSWYRADGNAADVRLLEMTTGRRRTVFHAEDVEDVPLVEWSHDGSTLLLRVEAKDGTVRMELVSVSDGTRRVLKPSWPRVSAAAAVFTPDDRFVVYDEPEAAGSSRDLRIIDVVSGHDALLLGGPTDDAEPMWAGAGVLFTSNRSEKRGLWRASLGDSRTAEEPTLVSDQLAIGFWPIGMTDGGSLFYAAAEGVSSVYVAEVSPGGEVATPAQLSASNEPALTPEWSPDGRTVAWVAPSRTSAPGAALRLRDLRTGSDRNLSMPFVIGQNPRWSPDGTRMLIRGAENGVAALRLVDIETGQLITSYLAGRQFGDVEWSADGTGAFFIDFDQRFIARLDIGSGAERIVYRLPDKQAFNRGIALSPDGETIAFHTFEGDTNALITIPAKGGTARTVYVVPRQHRVMLQEWTGDGRHLLFVRSRAIAGAGPSQEWQLWSIGISDRTLHYLDLSMPSLGAVRPDPDGRRIALSSSNAANRLRVLDNVLSATQ